MNPSCKGGLDWMDIFIGQSPCLDRGNVYGTSIGTPRMHTKRITNQMPDEWYFSSRFLGEMAIIFEGQDLQL